MKVGVGYSFLEDPKLRAQEAADRAMGEAGITRAQTAIVFTEAPLPSHYRDVLGIIEGVAGAKDVIGAASHGVLTLREEREENPGCVVLVLNAESEEGSFKSFLYRGSRGFEPRIDWGSLEEAGSLLLLSDPSLFDLDAYKPIYEYYKLPVFGGGASAFRAKNLPGAPIFYRKNCFQEASCLLGVPKGLQLHLSVSYGCRALSMPLEVTRARKNLVLELSGEPAVNVLERELAKVLDEAKAARAESGKPIPLLAGILNGTPVSFETPKSDEFYARPILAIDSDSGGILLSERLNEGCFITFVLRERNWSHQEMSKNLALLKTSLSGQKPLFGFYFNGFGRGHEFYGDESHDTRLIQKYLGDFPLIGMFSSFEIAPQAGELTMHGFAGVLAVYTK